MTKTRQYQSRTFQIVAGITLNGKIADEASGVFSAYSSPEDQKWLQSKISESDVVIMGRKSFELHGGRMHKPLIVFSRRVKGLQMEKMAIPEIHWFHDKKEDLMNLCDLLQYRKITILGGSEVYHWFLKQKLITDVYLTLEPFLIDKGKHLLNGEVFHELKSWRLESSKTLNDRGSILLHYQSL